MSTNKQSVVLHDSVCDCPFPTFQAGDAAMSSLEIRLLELVFKIAYCDVRPGHVYVGPIGPV